MDRCALFVDAGYVLADGAMAVHGTRHRESVSWNYAGLLQFFGNIARERTSLPLLRCYWYEATVEGRRGAEHDTLADLPGLKLRLGRLRPGRREGVEGEIRRDLTTLARNGAISDAVLVSAEEDLSQVVADVQDLGIRVLIVHITVGGNWTISRGLRQECDDIIEIGEGQLRPYTELVSGADALRGEDPYQLALPAGRALTNGHGPVVGPLGSHQALSAGSHPAPPAIYTAPVVAEYQRTAQPAAELGAPSTLPQRQPAGAGEHEPGSRAAAGLADPLGQTGPPGAPAPAQAPAPQNLQASPGGPGSTGGPAGPGGAQQRNMPSQQDVPSQPGMTGPQAAPAPPVMPGQQSMPGQPAGSGQPGMPGPPSMPGQPGMPEPPSMPGPQNPPQRPGMPGQPAGSPRQGMPGPPGMPGQPGQPMMPGSPGQPSPAGRSAMPGQPNPPGRSAAVPGQQDLPGQQATPGQHAAHGGVSSPSAAGLPDPRARGSHAQPVTEGQNAPTGSQPLYAAPSAGSFRGPPQDVPQPPVPGSSGLPGQNLPGQNLPGQGLPGQSYQAPGAAGPGMPGGQRPYSSDPYGAGPQEQTVPGQFPAPSGRPENTGSAYAPPASPYGGPQPGSPQAPVPPGQAMPLADAVQAAHAEGFEFGQSVAREAPALWLEAVLARKPRMPSDLEARLLQDSALPIDSLLHDETRHALRRGFWDALERSRR